MAMIQFSHPIVWFIFEQRTNYFTATWWKRKFLELVQLNVWNTFFFKNGIANTCAFAILRDSIEMFFGCFIHSNENTNPRMTL